MNELPPFSNLSQDYPTELLVPLPPYSLYTPIALSDLAALCVTLSRATVKKYAATRASAASSPSPTLLKNDPPSEVSTPFEVAVDLRHEASRLEEWVTKVKRHDLELFNTSRGRRNLCDRQIAIIVTTLLDEAEQFQLLLADRTDASFAELDGFRTSLSNASAEEAEVNASIKSARLLEQPCSKSIAEAVDHLSEMNDRLWSFSTALELRWAMNQSQLQVAQVTSQSTLPFPVPTRIKTVALEVKAATTSGDKGRKSQTSGKKYFTHRPPESEVVYKEPPPPYSMFENHKERLEKERIKVVIVGDGACGKSCALVSYMNGRFPEVYVPTVYEHYPVDGRIGRDHESKSEYGFNLDMYDTAGQSDYDMFRPLSYPDTDVVIISYSIDSPDSLDNTEEKFIAEVLHFNKGIPIILAGLKKDLRSNRMSIEELHKTGQKPVTYEFGLEKAARLGVDAYAECSAKTMEGLSDIFQAVAELGWQHRINKARSKHDSKCCTM